MKSHGNGLFALGSFPSVKFTLLHVAVIYLFSLLSGISLYEYTTVYTTNKLLVYFLLEVIMTNYVNIFGHVSWLKTKPLFWLSIYSGFQ